MDYSPWGCKELDTTEWPSSSSSTAYGISVSWPLSLGRGRESQPLDHRGTLCYACYLLSVLPCEIISATGQGLCFVLWSSPSTVYSAWHTASAYQRVLWLNEFTEPASNTGPSWGSHWGALFMEVPSQGFLSQTLRSHNSPQTWVAFAMCEVPTEDEGLSPWIPVMFASVIELTVTSTSHFTLLPRHFNF